MDAMHNMTGPNLVGSPDEAGQTASQAAPSRIALFGRDGARLTCLADRIGLAGFGLRFVTSEYDLSTALASNALDIVLLDAEGHPRAPHEVVGAIRQRSDVGIVFLTSERDTENIVRALEYGADDCLAGDIAPSEALARIQALQSRLARSNKPATVGYQFDEWRLDRLSRRLVNQQGEPVRLTAREYDALIILLDNANRPVRREQLLGLTPAGPSRAADALVGRLKRKLIAAGARTDLIRPIRSVGYQLVANTLPLS